jgi:hypothetical protein
VPLVSAIDRFLLGGITGLCSLVSVGAAATPSWVAPPAPESQILLLQMRMLASGQRSLRIDCDAADVWFRTKQAWCQWSFPGFLVGLHRWWLIGRHGCGLLYTIENDILSQDFGYQDRQLVMWQLKLPQKISLRANFVQCAEIRWMLKL